MVLITKNIEAQKAPAIPAVLASPAIKQAEPSTLLSSHTTIVCLVSLACYILVLGYAWVWRADEEGLAICGRYSLNSTTPENI
jgi:hypothetical protein